MDAHLERTAVRLIAAATRYDKGEAFIQIAEESGIGYRRLAYKLAKLAGNGLTRGQWRSLARGLDGGER